MPVSAYLRASILLIAAAAALFGSAGGLAIPTFWLYWAILVAVFIAAFAMVDRGLLQERMRPGGRPTPLGLRLLNVILLLHWVIAGLYRGHLHWTALGRSPRRPATARRPAARPAQWRVLGDAGEPVLFLGGARIQSDRGQRVVTDT